MTTIVWGEDTHGCIGAACESHIPWGDAWFGNLGGLSSVLDGLAHGAAPVLGAGDFEMGHVAMVV